MAWEDLPFEDFEDSDAIDEELDEILGKIDEIIASEEEDQQQELIELCDLALKRVEISQPENIELLDLLNWFAGYAYLELADDDVLITRGLSYINLIRTRTSKWHLAYAQIHFNKEKFIESIEHLDLLEKTITIDIKNKKLNRETAQMFRQMSKIGRMRISLAIGQMEEYDVHFSQYLRLITHYGIQSGLNHFGVSQDLIRFDSNVQHLASVLSIEDEFGALFGIKEALLSQISYLQGDINQSNKYAYDAKKRVTDGGAFEADVWKGFLDDENDRGTPTFTIGAFECPLLDSPPAVYCLMEERASQYLNDFNISLSAYFDQEIGLSFPLKLVNIDYQILQFYDEEGFGYSLRYGDGNNIKIDIYVYDYAENDIEDGISSQKTKDEFDKFYSMIGEMQTQGHYRNAIELHSGEKIFYAESMKYLWSQFQYEISPNDEVEYDGEVISNIYLTAFKGKFIKVRLTIKKEAQFDREADIEAFMNALSKLLVNSRQ
jgi:hypothetical protein